MTPIPIADETIFLKWAGDLTGDDSPVEITVDQPKTVTATFEFAVYNGVVGKWKVKKEKAGTSKNFEIDYIIFNSDFTYEVGLIDDADSNDTSTALVTGTFDIISNEKIELYQVTVQLEPISAGAVDNIKLEINNTISFELDFAPKTGDFIGTIKQTVDNATKDLNYDPVTKSTITQTTTSVTSTSTTSSNTTQSFTSTPTLTFPKFQSNVFNFCNNQPIPSDAVSWFIFYDPSSLTSLTSQNAITNIEVSNLPNGINFTIDNQPDDLNGSAQIAIKIGGTPIDNSLGSYQVQISAVNGYTGLKESASFSVKIDSCTTTQTGSVTQTTTTATTPTNTTGTSTNTSSTSTANPDSGTSTGTTTSTNSSQDSKSFVVQVLLFENNSSDYRVLLSEDRLGGLNGDADPDLNFYVGDTISFEVNTPGHPFYLKTVRGTGNGDLISGVANNGIINGTISWTPSVEGTYYYQCSLHSGMVGTINITN